MRVPETINGMRVLCWAELSCIPVPWERFPPDVVGRWQRLVYCVICLGDEDSTEYHFMMCDKNWFVGASEFSYTIDGAKAALAKELMIEHIQWNNA